MDPYETYYTGLRFERAELFYLIRKKYSCSDVLYPGCSIHITPSLFFPHVVYVDKSEEPARFFAQDKSLLDYINRHKQYKRSTYLRFIRQDYSQPLPLMAGTFDLVLALFAGGIARSCKDYLKRGGFLISNNHQNDAVDARKDAELQLITLIKFRGGQYRIIENGIDAIKIPVQKSYKKALRQTGGHVEYLEHETYYVFKRTSA